jgi:hypothetical protein
MTDEKSFDPNISAYLRRPIRKLREAEEDKDASDSQWNPIPPPGSSGRGEARDKYSNPLKTSCPKRPGRLRLKTARNASECFPTELN